MKRTLLILLLAYGSALAQPLPFRVHKAPKIVKPDSSIGVSQDSVKIFVGKRGGQYWLDASGKKHYIKRSK